MKVHKGKPRLCGASGQSLASHRWGPEFVSRSLNVGFVVDKLGLGRFFSTSNFIPLFLHTHLIHFVSFLESSASLNILN